MKNNRISLDIAFFNIPKETLADPSSWIWPHP